jgi:hypothetical protein
MSSLIMRLLALTLLAFANSRRLPRNSFVWSRPPIVKTAAVPTAA